MTREETVERVISEARRVVPWRAPVEVCAPELGAAATALFRLEEALRFLDEASG